MHYWSPPWIFQELEVNIMYVSFLETCYSLDSIDLSACPVSRALIRVLGLRLCLGQVTIFVNAIHKLSFRERVLTNLCFMLRHVHARILFPSTFLPPPPLPILSHTQLSDHVYRATGNCASPAGGAQARGAQARGAQAWGTKARWAQARGTSTRCVSLQARTCVHFVGKERERQIKGMAADIAVMALPTPLLCTHTWTRRTTQGRRAKTRGD